MSHENCSEMTVDELIAQFESDMRSSTITYSVRYLKSKARSTLVELGSPALPDIIEHLSSLGLQEHDDVCTAWKTTLNELGNKHHKVGMPSTIAPMKVWIDWAINTVAGVVTYQVQEPSTT